MAMSEQLDLFSGGGVAPPAPDLGLWTPTDPTRLSDRSLLAAIPRANQTDAAALAREAVRRGLRDAVPALEALCRRFKGFGRDHAVVEQEAAFRALAELGGQESVTRLIADGAVQGPGVLAALEAAASLKCRLPTDRVAQYLRENDPAIRAAACRCARPSAAVFAALIDLLTDLHPPVVLAAAQTLGRLGRREGMERLVHRLRTEPDRETIAALIPIAGDEEIVRLGQTALTHPDLAPEILTALDDIDTPRAATVASGIRRRLGVTA